MKQTVMPGDYGSSVVERIGQYGTNFPKHAVIGMILIVALLAFEIFNFDTTRYALSNLLGPVSFGGLAWATILAVAFCAIDFAGLIRLFTPEGDGEQPKEVWYLMGAWLLGATMNALMTWWAISLTLLSHDFGNEVLSRAQLLQVVPIFVAVLVWLTRILFIGALTMAGEHLMAFRSQGSGARAAVPVPANTVIAGHKTLMTRRPALAAGADTPSFLHQRERSPRQASQARRVAEEAPQPAPRSARTAAREAAPEATKAAPPQLRKVEEEKEVPESKRRPAPTKPNGRVRQRPPVPGGVRGKGISARSRSRN